MITAYIISFIIVSLLVMCAILLVTYQKDKKPRNKVKFYITKDKPVNLITLKLWIGLPSLAGSGDYFYSNGINNYVKVLAHNKSIEKYNLNPKDFDDMEVGEIREVFINLED